MAKRPEQLITPLRPIRCAIYTRKSTEEGLEQEFNSLHAQREAAEAYILSQRQAGWVAVPQEYGDGGFTGGNLERPALQQLLSEIEAGQMDCVVVYKVDRLSRSLLDFARIMAIFDQRGVSFVSVTQQFNTSTSLGRLTLNILLSFAQFEREIIGERTRDKMSAARRKGKWVGGHPVLGYDVDPRGGRLLIHAEEAEQVRTLFAWYDQQQAVIPTLALADGRGWTTKTWVTNTGKHRQGKPFVQNSLLRLLSNPVYKGAVSHKGQLYPGEQAAIVDAALWERVNQALQARKHTPRSGSRNQHQPLLQGLLECEPCGCAMVHTYTAKKGRRYRYYVCKAAQRNGRQSCPGRSVPAHQIEESLLKHIEAAAQTAGDGDLLEVVCSWRSLDHAHQVRALRQTVERVRYDGRTGRVSICLKTSEGEERHAP